MSYLTQIIENAPELSSEDQAIIWRVMERFLPEKPKEVDVLDLFDKSPTDQRVIAAIKLIWEKPSKTTNDLDKYFFEKFNRSWDTVARFFPTETGTSAKKALELVRLELARRLIIKDKRSISVVLMEAGIYIAHFEAKFRYQYGMTPREYRRRHSEF